MTRLLAWALLPGVLLGLVIVSLLVIPAWTSAPWRPSPLGLPPLERLVFERVIFDDRGISALVRAGPMASVRIAQVQVDGAFWEFAQDPLGDLTPLSAGWLRIPYPWVLGEGHAISVVTSHGLVFQHRVPVAMPTIVRPDLPLIGLLAACLGLLPIALAGAVRPALGLARRGSGTIAYSVSIALLLVLLVQTVRAALASMAETTSAHESGLLVWLAASATGAGLIAVGLLGRAGPVAGATMTAVGLAAHRLCQGLAVGGAVALESTPLAIWLTLGFLLHNLLVGAGTRPPQAAGPGDRAGRFARLLVLGVAPLFGAWFGGQAAVPFWAAMALAAGAGSILAVAGGAVRLLVHRAASPDAAGRALFAALPAALGVVCLTA